MAIAAVPWSYTSRRERAARQPNKNAKKHVYRTVILGAMFENVLGKAIASPKVYGDQSTGTEDAPWQP